MPKQLKPVATYATKWAQRAAGASAEYQSGVQAPSEDWQAKTEAAAPAYQEGVNAAVARQAFQKGVRAAGTAKWQAKAATIGASRYAPGVGAGKEAYQTAVQPYLDTLAALDYGPRGPKGAPQNVDRVRKVAEALHRRKTGA